jgi:hypothetical protein
LIKIKHIYNNKKKLCEQFNEVEKILIQCTLWREAITEQVVDISFVSQLSQELTTRKDLWKYYQVTYHHVKDWKNTPIKKVATIF